IGLPSISCLIRLFVAPRPPFHQLFRRTHTTRITHPSLHDALPIFCSWLTSKMSHDHSRHDSCRLRLYSRWIHSIVLSLARGMTAVVVGSGVLLGLFFILSSFRAN